MGFERTDSREAQMGPAEAAGVISILPEYINNFVTEKIVTLSSKIAHFNISEFLK